MNSGKLPSPAKEKDKDGDVLVRRAEALAQPIRGAETLETRFDDWLLFLRLDKQYAVRVACVQEVCPFTTFTLVPNSRDLLVGIINVRGMIYSIVDPIPLLHHGSAKNPLPAKVILLDSGTLQVALAVDRVKGLRSLARAEIYPSPVTQESGTSGIIHGVTADHWVLLEIEAVLKDPRVSNFSKREPLGKP